MSKCDACDSSHARELLLDALATGNSSFPLLSFQYPRHDGPWAGIRFPVSLWSPQPAGQFPNCCSREQEKLLGLGCRFESDREPVFHLNELADVGG